MAAAPELLSAGLRRAQGREAADPVRGGGAAPLTGPDGRILSVDTLYNIPGRWRGPVKRAPLFRERAENGGERKTMPAL